MSSLDAALLEHPGLRELILNGRHVLVTPYLASRWLVDQLEIPAAVRAALQLRVYEGGHMVYMRPASRALLARYAAELYAPAAPTQYGGRPASSPSPPSPHLTFSASGGGLG